MTCARVRDGAVRTGKEGRNWSLVPRKKGKLQEGAWVSVSDAEDEFEDRNRKENLKFVFVHVTKEIAR